MIITVVKKPFFLIGSVWIFHLLLIWPSGEKQPNGWGSDTFLSGHFFYPQKKFWIPLLKTKEKEKEKKQKFEVNVLDGDTLKMPWGSIRLLWIDAPEKDQKGFSGEYLGHAAWKKIQKNLDEARSSEEDLRITLLKKKMFINVF